MTAQGANRARFSWLQATCCRFLRPNCRFLGVFYRGTGSNWLDGRIHRLIFLHVYRLITVLNVNDRTLIWYLSIVRLTPAKLLILVKSWAIRADTNGSSRRENLPICSEPITACNHLAQIAILRSDTIARSFLDHLLALMEVNMAYVPVLGVGWTNTAILARTQSRKRAHAASMAWYCGHRSCAYGSSAVGWRHINVLVVLVIHLNLLLLERFICTVGFLYDLGGVVHTVPLSSRGHSDWTLMVWRGNQTANINHFLCFLLILYLTLDLGESQFLKVMWAIVRLIGACLVKRARLWRHQDIVARSRRVSELFSANSLITTAHARISNGSWTERWVSENSSVTREC